jgi:hypothetical protein
MGVASPRRAVTPCINSAVVHRTAALIQSTRGLCRDIGAEREREREREREFPPVKTLRMLLYGDRSKRDTKRLSIPIARRNHSGCVLTKVS